MSPRFSEKYYWIAIGVILAGLVVALGFLAAANVRLSRELRNQPVQNQNAPAASSDAVALLGLADTPPLLTSNKILFSGTVMEEVIAVEIRTGAQAARVAPDQNRRWELDFSRSSIATGTVVFVIAAKTDQGSFETQRSINLPEIAVAAPEKPEKFIEVAWRQVPLKLNNYDIAGQMGVSVSDLYNIYEDAGGEQPELYKLGEIKSGEYQGDELVLAYYPCDGICFEKYSTLLVPDKNAKKIVVLAAYSGGNYYQQGHENNFFEEKYLVTRNDLGIKDLDLPATAQIDRNFSLEQTGTLLFVLEEDAKEIGKTKDGRVIYQIKNGCLALLRRDARYQRYDLKLPFYEAEKDFDRGYLKDENGNNVGNARFYIHGVSGCGSLSCFNLVPSVSQSSLKFEAKTATGGNLYQYASAADPGFQKFYKENYVPYFGEKESAAQVLAKTPFLLWQDPFGRWVSFTKEEFIPPVECGKPVVYLYPQKEMSVKVAVGLKGKMTKSEPEHGARGWDVVAKPDGYVVNKADGKIYPNLYWEGTGVGYKIPEQGYVIAGSEADPWLKMTLAQIGFTARESAEFREFWVPRLPKTPYVFITFVPQSDFDRDAPLRITPRPDSVTRVFMEYRGLAAPISVAPLPLPKIERRGFTVVEWGGALKM